MIILKLCYVIHSKWKAEKKADQLRASSKSLILLIKTNSCESNTLNRISFEPLKWNAASDELQSEQNIYLIRLKMWARIHFQMFTIPKRQQTI